jgi:hypothetical protein
MSESIPVPLPQVTLNDVPKELRATVADAVARGWALDRRKGAGRHFRLVHPDYRPVPVACTQSERLAGRKLKSQLRRAERGI